MPIKNGKVFRSKPAGFQVIVRGKEPKQRDYLGQVTEYYTELVAEFAEHLGELQFVGDGSFSPERFADIRGHYFDSAMQAEKNGWTQEEHDLVVNKVLAQCKITPEWVWEVTAKQFPLPWPTYDTVAAGKVATLAESLGLTVEALQYERQNQNRKQVVADLEALVNAAQSTELVEGDLVAS